MVKVKVRGQVDDWGGGVSLSLTDRFLLISFQLDFTAEQIEGKFIIKAVAGVAWAIYRRQLCV